jgi:hypothetical protein
MKVEIESSFLSKGNEEDKVRAIECFLGTRFTIPEIVNALRSLTNKDPVLAELDDEEISRLKSGGFAIYGKR